MPKPKPTVDNTEHCEMRVIDNACYAMEAYIAGIENLQVVAETRIAIVPYLCPDCDHTHVEVLIPALSLRFSTTLKVEDAEKLANGIMNPFPAPLDRISKAGTR